MSFHFDTALAAKLKTANPDVLEEIVRQSELRLQHSAATALHRDIRNLTTGMAFAAFSAAGVTAAAAGLGGEDANWVLAWFGGVLGAGMMLAAVMALWQARPRQYWTPGNPPRVWLLDIEAGCTMQDARADTATIHQTCIDSNEAIAAEQRRGMMHAWYVAAASAVSAICAAVFAAS